MFYKKFSEIKVGIFVLIAIIIVTSTLFWAKGFIINKDRIDLKVYFQSVSGLNYGDPVSVNGVNKGKVLNIELEGDSVLVLFSLEKDVKIKKDYIIEVTSLALMSGKSLYIYPGKSGEEINYDKPLKGKLGADMTSMMKTVDELSGDIKELLKKFNNSADKIDTALTNLNEVIGDKNMQNDLKGSISNLRVLTRNLNNLVSESRINIKNLTDDADKTMENLNNVVDESKPDIKSSFKDIQNLTIKFDTLVTNLNLIVSDIHNQKSGVGKFIYDEQFFKNLNNTLLEVEKLTKKIRQDGVKINLF